MTTSYFLKHPAKSHAFRQFWGDSRSPWSCKIAWRQFWLRKWEQGGSLENKKSSEKLEKLTIRISKSKKEMLKKMVEKSSYNSLSEIARAGIEKELNVEMYKESLDFIVKALDQMLDEKLKPFIASQRKINAKYLRTSVINTYLQGEVMYKLLGDDMHKEFINMLNNARKKANYYISRDTEKMHKQDLYDFYTIGELYWYDLYNGLICNI